MNLTRVWLQAGQVVNVGGIPYRLVSMTEAETHPGNIDLSNVQIAKVCPHCGNGGPGWGGVPLCQQGWAGDPKARPEYAMCILKAS